MKRFFSAMLAVILLFAMNTAFAGTTLTEITCRSGVLDGTKLLIRQNSGGIAITLVSDGAEHLLAGAEKDTSGHLVIGSELLPGCVTLSSANDQSQDIVFSTANLIDAGLIGRITISSEKGITYYTLELDRDAVSKLLPAAAADLKATQGLSGALGLSDTAFASMVDALAARLKAYTESDGFVPLTLSILECKKAFYGV